MLSRTADSRPCKGDAWRPGRLVFDRGIRAVEQLRPAEPKDGCIGCALADVNGGKCAGPRADDVVLVVLAAQIPAVLARGMEDLQRAVDAFACRVREFVACGHAGGHDDFA